MVLRHVARDHNQLENVFTHPGAVACNGNREFGQLELGIQIFSVKAHINDRFRAVLFGKLNLQRVFGEYEAEFVDLSGA